MKKIGVIGSCGMVGNALKKYFKKQNKHTLFLYDLIGEGSVEEINQADYIYVCVPTPYDEKLGCDTKILEKAIDVLTGSKIIIIKSTVVPGTTDRLQKEYPQHRFLFNPEFLTEVTADQDMNYPDRQIIGYTSEGYAYCGDVLAQLPLATFEIKVLAFVAEFAKYACNTWFSTKVSKNNELYDVFSAFGGNDNQFKQLIDCVSGDKRIGRTHLEILHKGYRGYGGKCLEKDMKAFLKFAQKLKVKMPISLATDKYNDGLKNLTRNKKPA